MRGCSRRRRHIKRLNSNSSIERPDRIGIEFASWPKIGINGCQRSTAGTSVTGFVPKTPAAPGGLLGDLPARGPASPRVRRNGPPKVSGSKGSTDFLAEEDESSFYLEAICYFDRERTSAGERRRNRLYDAIDQLWNPNFHVWLDIETEGGSSPPGGPLRNALDDWLVSLDPDEVNATHDTHNMFDLPSFTWERDGWSIRLAHLAAARAPPPSANAQWA